MAPRIVRLLHVEDNTMRQKILAHHLTQIQDLQFAVTYARSEDEAVAEFRRRLPDVVIMDYHLKQGNGLSCIRTMRREDPVVPIVAVSGEATPAIAAQLLQNGADDFICKHELRSDNLKRSIRVALLRADAWHRRQPAFDESTEEASRLATSLEKVSTMFLSCLDTAVWRSLDECATTARELKVTAEQLQQAYHAVCTKTAARQQSDASVIARHLRPLLLELHARLADTDQ